ncbi:MAG: xanthine permease [Sporomusa sp.]|nr:xanthine permease [Sporomusa sp.]
MQNAKQVIGYLPDEKPPIWKLLLYAIQQVIVMFPATVAVALITQFHISTTIFASGLATICFILVTGRKIPLYYGSSFSYLSAILGIMGAEQLSGAALNEKIAIAQFGIIMSGLVSIAAGLIVKRFGRESIEKVLPATITGPIAMVIGLTLARNALLDAASISVVDGSFALTNIAEGQIELAKNLAWVISLVTILSTILLSVYLKGFAGQLPLLLGPIIGCATAFIIQLITGISFFKALPEAAVSSGIFALPEFTLPIPNWAAVAAIMPIAIATIPESTAHVYQLDIYVNDLAKKKGTNKKYDISNRLGHNLIGDGIGDMVAGFIGGPAGTNYGENISAMAITKVFSIPVLMVAAVIAMIISCFTPLRKVDLFSSKNIAVIATIMIIGLGGQYGFGGSIPFFGLQVPCVAGAAVFGIILNLILSIGNKKDAQVTE